MQPLVSVIVPVYNGEEYFNRCLDSIVNQKYRNIEIVIVDDGSDDLSGNIAEEYANKDNRIKVIHKRNTGVSDSRNVAINVSKGELICFVDSDDIIHKLMIDVLVKTITNTNSDISVCLYQRISSDYEFRKELTIPNHKNLVGDEMVEHLFDSKICGGFLWNKLYRRKLIDQEPKIRFHSDFTICEDEVFNIEYLMRCKMMSWVESPLYGYRINYDSALHKKVTLNSLSVIDARLYGFTQVKKYYANAVAQKYYKKILFGTFVNLFYKLLREQNKDFRLYKKVTGKYLEFIKTYGGEYSLQPCSLKERIKLGVLHLSSIMYRLGHFNE